MTKIPSSLPEPKKPDETKSEGELKKGQFFSQLTSMFSWLGDLITVQTKEEEEANIEPFAHAHEAREKKMSALIKTAEQIISNLDETKSRLLQEFGGQATGFISKSIAPMIAHAKSLIVDLRDRRKTQSSLDKLLDQAVQSVELYTEFRDEKKLMKKIIEEAQDFARQTIEKDFEILSHYRLHILEELGNNLTTEEKEKILEQIDNRLFPIFEEMKEMGNEKVEIIDLRDLFVWKAGVDAKRDSLMEMGFLTIDAFISQIRKGVLETSGTFEANREFLEELFWESDEHLEQLATLTLLDEQALYLSEQLETEFLDTKSLEDIERALFDLREHVDGINLFVSPSSKLQDGFQVVISSINRAEALLKERRRRLGK